MLFSAMVSANQIALAPRPEPISKTVRGRSSAISTGYIAKSKTFFISGAPRLVAALEPLLALRAGASEGVTERWLFLLADLRRATRGLVAITYRSAPTARRERSAPQASWLLARVSAESTCDSIKREGDSSKEAPARTPLRCSDADAGAVTDLVRRIEHVDDV